ncbi:hypothetical protein ABZP36_011190 [Zizania latifolia]
MWQRVAALKHSLCSPQVSRFLVTPVAPANYFVKCPFRLPDSRHFNNSALTAFQQPSGNADGLNFLDPCHPIHLYVNPSLLWTIHDHSLSMKVVKLHFSCSSIQALKCNPVEL